MKGKSNIFSKTDFLLTGIFFLLLITAIMTSAIKRKSVNEIKKSTLLNSKNINYLNTIVLKEKENVLTLKKYDEIWTGTFESNEGIITFPCDVQTVNNLIEKASEIKKFRLISKKTSAHEKLGLSEDNCFRMVFISDREQILSDICFGNENLNSSVIAVRSKGKTESYEIENSISVFLTLKNSFWCDPYIFPDCLTGEKNSSGKLRHGNVTFRETENESGKAAVFLRKDFANGTKIFLETYEYPSSGYLVIPHFAEYPSLSEKDSEAVKTFSYAYFLSQWTYGKLSEEKED